MNRAPGPRVLLATAALVIGASGCAAAGPVPEPVPAPSPTPSFGPEVITLAEFGVSNGPAELVPLPSDVEIGELIDQENVVTVVITQPSGEEFVDFLSERLPEAGFSIKAESDQGIIFDGYGWDGGATAGQGIDGAGTALTLRRA